MDEYKKEKIDNLIALCHIMNEYKEFIKNLKELITVSYNRDIIENLRKISNGEFVLGSKKVKRFYEDNKSTIDTINKYSSINSFICSNYDSDGDLYEESAIDFFYEYFNNHKKDLDKILILLEKFKRLGGWELKFNENTDFTSKEYYMNPSFTGTSKIYILDNIEVLPNYDNYLIKYKTSGSNYELETIAFRNKFTQSDISITVNSLLFDPDKLPDVISNEAIIDKIIDMRNSKEEECTNIKNAIDLRISVDNLNKQFMRTNEIMNRIKNIENKEVLLHIKSLLEQLEDISLKYEEDISQDYSDITTELIQKEKEFHLVAIERQKMHFD